ncbi:hypothetical protein Tco_1201784 [Tanacetum coccineum]
MSDEPLGDDSKPRSYDVTFSNPLFDFNDDFTLCNDNPLFDEEFEDISSLDPPKSAPLNYEPLDDSIPTEIDDGYYDSEGDILFLEHLLIEETFSNPTPAVLPKKSTLLVTPPPASKQFSLRELERFDSFFSLTQSDIPSDESKVRIEVLSVLWGNRLPIPDGSLLLSRTPDVSQYSYKARNPRLIEVYWLCRLGRPMCQSSKRLREYPKLK